MLRRSLVPVSIFAFAVMALPAPVSAKARFLGMTELVETADVIAVVEVTETREVEQVGEHWTYRQEADVTRVKMIKGRLPAFFRIHAQKDFICARASYEPGRYLVFLRAEKDLYTPVNHHLGALQIDEDQVSWYADREKVWDRTSQPLDHVVEEISTLLD